MKVPGDLKYTKDHEWLRVDGETGFIGISEFAQGELGDVVFIEVDTVGETIEKQEAFGTIEAVKTVSDIFMPVAGVILEFNEALESNPDLVNKDPYGDGWIVKIRITNASQIDQLMDAESYKQHIGA